MQATSAYDSWKVFKLKRRVRTVSDDSSRPLASLWRSNQAELEEISVGMQLSIADFWAESIYGRDEANRLGLAARTEALVERSMNIYRGRAIDPSQQPMALKNPLRIVMGELNC